MAKKRLNKNVVIGLTLFVFGMMIVLSVVMLTQLRKRDPQYFVDLAETAASGGHWEQAGLFYREAYRRSEDATHLVKFGDALLELGDVTNALNAWSQALVTQPDLLVAHRTQLGVLHEMAKLSRKTAAWQQVLRAAENMLDAAGVENAGDPGFALHAKGMALLNLAVVDPGNNALGLEALEEAVALSPDRVTYAVDLARNYILLDQRENARVLLDELLSRHAEPGAAGSRARAAYAMYQADSGEDDAALSYFGDAIEFAKNTPEARLEAQLACSAFLMRQWARAKQADSDNPNVDDKFNEAVDLLRSAIAEHPESYDPYIQLATLYQTAPQHADGVGVCEDRLARGLSRKGVHANRDRHSTFILMILAAESCVAEAASAQREERPDEADAWLARADQFVADARGEVPDHPRVFAQAGQIKAARGQYRAALEDLRAADEAYRGFAVTDWSNKMLLARVHLQLREPGAARRVIEDVLAEARGARANDAGFWLLYAQTLIETDDLERALFYTENILRSAPDLAPAKQLKASILERQGRLEQAGTLIEEATGDQTLRTILEARNLAMEGNADGALAILEDALESDPGNVRLVSAAVTELVSRDNSAEAERIVDRALRANPDDSQLARLSVLIDPDLTKEERAAALLRRIKSQEDAYKRELEIASFNIQQDNLPEALAALTAAEQHLIVKDTPTARNARVAQHRALLRLRMRVAGRLDDQAALAAARDNAARYNVDAANGKSLLGLYHHIRDENDLAIRALRQAVTRQPTDAWAQTLLGQCLYRAGRTEEARAAYDSALRANPRDGLAYRGLALMALEDGDEAAFEQHFEACTRLIPRDAWVRSISRARVEQEDPLGAIDRRERDLAEEPDDIENLKRLAHLSEQVTDLDRADRYYARLADLAPEDREIASVVAAYYRRTNRPERSLQILQDFAGSRPPGEERNAALILVAVHHLELQQYDQAEQTLLEAAAATASLDVVLAVADFYMQEVVAPARAIPWLDKAVEIAEAEGSGRLPRVIQARIQCKLSRPVDDAAGAQQDVDLLAARFPNDPATTLWQGEVYVQSGRISDAIKAFTDYLAQRPNQVEALFRRAKLETVHGNYPAAIDDLEAIKRIDPVARDLAPRLLLAKLYFRIDKPDRCLQELQSLVADAPDSERALQTLVETYVELGQAAAADTIVTSQINRSGDNPDPRWLRLRARISWALGDFDRALADSRQAVRMAGNMTHDDLVTMLEIFYWARRYSEGIEYYAANAPSVAPDARVEGRHAALQVLNGDDQAGAASFRRAAQLAGADDTNAILALAESLRMAFPDGASMNRALALFPGQPGQVPWGEIDTRLRLRLNRLRNDGDGALDDIRELLPHAKEDLAKAVLLHEKGELLQQAGRSRDARRAYEEALEHNGDDWRTLNNLAYLLTNDLDACGEGLVYARKAATLNADADVLDTLGWTHACLGDYRKAVAELSRALRLEPGAALALYHLGEAYRRDGAFAEADESLSSALAMARQADDDSLSQQVEASIERVNQRDRTP